MKQRTSERGSALMLVVIIVLILVGISLAYTSISWWNSRRAYQDESQVQALYIAESAAAIYINNLNVNTAFRPQLVAKQKFAGENGSFWVPSENLVDFGDGTVVGATNKDPNFVSFQVAGNYGGVTRRINVFMSGTSGGVFWNAIFAGNSSGDPYSLNLGGAGTRGDTVVGNVYTGGDLKAGDPARIYDMDGNANGASVTYGGTNNSTITGTTPTYKQEKQEELSIPRSYGNTNSQLEAEANAQKFFGTADRMDPATGVKWVDVGGEFSKNGQANHQWHDGSYATDIMDRDNPAHIFRKDPSSTSGSTRNRTETYEYTAPSAKSDYYLEDPTSSNVTQTMLYGTDHPVNGDTTASMVNVKENGNNAVYFIDGNMRISGEPVKSYQLSPDASVKGPLKMTIVVKGNVSLTDNLLYPKWMSESDAVAIIAVKDDNYPNTVPALFANSGATLPPIYATKNPGKTTANDFVIDYNTRAASGRSRGLNMPDINLGTAEGQAKAAQEYNKIYGSGNVFFGDPGSGTVEHFESYMYAENNFYATNLDTTSGSGGTRVMEIYGNMTAGNQVNIERSVNSQYAVGGLTYVPLSVTFDQAIMKNGGPPGLPQTPGSSGKDWHILSWKQTANTAETGYAAKQLEK